jgi:sugar lactone lactonase YvrE
MKNLLAALALLAPCRCAGAVPGAVLGAVSSPGPGPAGLAWDGEALWSADRREARLYRFDRQGRTLKSLDAPGFKPSGIAFDGKALWVSDLEEGRIFRMDPADGTVLKVIEAPTPHPSGLAWAEGSLWTVDEGERRLLRLDPSDGTVLQWFKSPSKACLGLAYDGRYLWVSDRKENLIHLVSPEHEDVVFSVPAPGPFAFGLAFDGRDLWCADYQDRRIHRLEAGGADSFAASQPKRERLEFTASLLNYGPSRLKSARIFIAVPSDRESQRLLSPVEFTPKPKELLNDRYGQPCAVFDLGPMGPSERRDVRMSLDAELKSASHFIFPHRVGSLDDIPKDVREAYTGDGTKYDLKSPFLQAKVQEASLGEKNPYWIARKLYDWLIARMEYKLSGGWETAPQVLKRGNGSCSEYTFSFLALCRAAGIPARFVGSMVVRNDDASWDEVFHRWAEIYLPGYGWVPVDANAGDKEEPFEQARAFGSIENRFLITTAGGGDSDLLGWSYIHKEEWSAENGKTRVRVGETAEWSPLPKP